MRLAEDRILSFLLVFLTGLGTKWAPGATFHYTPEITWQQLLKQRRRWFNGTLAAYIYLFIFDRAQVRFEGGLFDG